MSECDLVLHSARRSDHRPP